MFLVVFFQEWVVTVSGFVLSEFANNRVPGSGIFTSIAFISRSDSQDRSSARTHIDNSTASSHCLSRKRRSRDEMEEDVEMAGRETGETKEEVLVGLIAVGH